MTLILALLGVRLEAILIEALCAVAAAWFVYPSRTEAVIRRRLAGALRALDDCVERLPHAIAESQNEFARFEHRMAELENVGRATKRSILVARSNSRIK